MTKATTTTTTPPPAQSTLNIAESRRGSHLLRLRHDLDVASAFAWPMNPSCSQESVARMQSVGEQNIRDAAARIAAVEQLSGWDLVTAYGGDLPGRGAGF